MTRSSSLFSFGQNRWCSCYGSTRYWRSGNNGGGYWRGHHRTDWTFDNAYLAFGLSDFQFRDIGVRDQVDQCFKFS